MAKAQLLDENGDEVSYPGYVGDSTVGGIAALSSAWSTADVHLTVSKRRLRGEMFTLATCRDDDDRRLADVFIHEMGHLQGAWYSGPDHIHSEEAGSPMRASVPRGCVPHPPTEDDACAIGACCRAESQCDEGVGCEG